MKLEYIIFIAVGHFLADFVAQTHSMATGKSTSVLDLFRHTLSYLGAFSAWAVVWTLIECLFLNLHPTGYSLGAIRLFVFWLLLNTGLHFVTDYFSSAKTKQLWDAKDVHNFFVAVGLDQLVHYLILFTTWHYIIG